MGISALFRLEPDSQRKFIHPLADEDAKDDKYVIPRWLKERNVVRIPRDAVLKEGSKIVSMPDQCPRYGTHICLTIVIWALTLLTAFIAVFCLLAFHLGGANAETWRDSATISGCYFALFLLVAAAYGAAVRQVDWLGRRASKRIMIWRLSVCAAYPILLFVLICFLIDKLSCLSGHNCVPGSVVGAMFDLEAVLQDVTKILPDIRVYFTLLIFVVAMIVVWRIFANRSGIFGPFFLLAFATLTFLIGNYAGVSIVDDIQGMPQLLFWGMVFPLVGWIIFAFGVRKLRSWRPIDFVTEYAFFHKAVGVFARTHVHNPVFYTEPFEGNWPRTGHVEFAVFGSYQYGGGASRRIDQVSQKEHGHQHGRGIQTTAAIREPKNFEGLLSELKESRSAQYRKVIN